MHIINTILLIQFQYEINTKQNIYKKENILNKNNYKYNVLFSNYLLLQIY
jgi:hypothetical protein